MIDGVEPDQAYRDEVDGDDVVQQPRNDQDQNAGDEGDERRDVSDGENHNKTPRMVRMLRLATIDAPYSCTDAKCDATAFSGLILISKAASVGGLVISASNSYLKMATGSPKGNFSRAEW
jgi:hypothetical protein